jgi:hypothetical protein
MPAYITVGVFFFIGLYLLIARLLGAQRNLPPVSVSLYPQTVFPTTEEEIAALKLKAEAGDKVAARKLIRFYASGPGNLYKDHAAQYRYWRAIADKTN